MEFSIREYKDSDRDALVKCMVELQEYVMSVDPRMLVQCKPEFGELYTVWLLNLLKENSGIVYFAEVNGKIIGCAAGIMPAHEPQETAGGGPIKYGRVQEMYVDANYRGAGVGKVLMEKTEEYFRKSGCDTVYVEVFAPNKSAHEFYKICGYADRDINLMKKL